jgi:hypothetical protein
VSVVVGKYAFPKLFCSRTSLLSVARDSSAHAHLIDLVVFLSTKEKMERFTKDTNWSEFSKPVLEEARERMPDAAMLAELLSKKKPPATNTGEPNCRIVGVSLTLKPRPRLLLRVQCVADCVLHD